MAGTEHRQFRDEGSEAMTTLSGLGRGMTYDQMPAGDEMDRLIAKKVMGWTEHPDEIQFYPSIDMAHAWEVVEHLRLSRGLGHMTTFDPDSHGEEANCCVFRALRGIPGKRAMGIGKDMPLAICRASLKAVSP